MRIKSERFYMMRGGGNFFRLMISQDAFNLSSRSCEYLQILSLLHKCSILYATYSNFKSKELNEELMQLQIQSEDVKTLI